MFKTGLKHGVIVLVMVVLATVLASLSKDEQVIAFTMSATTIVAWLVVGYIYRKNNGPILSLSSVTSSSRTNILNGFWGYILGVGLIWGPLKLLLAGFPMTETNIITNVFLVVSSIPLAGMAAIGALLVGGLFYRPKA